MAPRSLTPSLIAATAVGLALCATMSERPHERAQAPAKIQKPRDVRETRKARLAMLQQALPGNGGESPRGPASADEEAFLQRAYPDVDIPAQRRIRSRESFFSFNRHGRRFG